MEANDTQNVPALNQVDFHEILAAAEIASEQDDFNQYFYDEKDFIVSQDTPSSLYLCKVEPSFYATNNSHSDCTENLKEFSMPLTPSEPQSPEDSRELLSPTINNLQLLEQFMKYETDPSQPVSPEDTSYNSLASPEDSIRDNEDIDDAMCEVQDFDVDQVVAEDVELEEPSKRISDRDLISLSVRDLNRKLKRLTPADAKQLKQRRRLLKNRGYAQTCRSRRIQEYKSLSYQNRSLQQTIKDLQNELARVSRERDEYKEKFELLQVGSIN